MKAVVFVMALALLGSAAADISSVIASCEKCSVIEKSLMRITGAEQKDKWDIMLVHDWCQLLPTEVHKSKCLDTVMKDDMTTLARMVAEHHHPMCQRNRLCDLHPGHNSEEAKLAYMADVLVQATTEAEADAEVNVQAVLSDSKLPLSSRIKHLFGKKPPSWHQIRKYGRRTVRYMKEKADALYRRYKASGDKGDHRKAFEYAQKAKRIAKLVAAATKQRSSQLMRRAIQKKRDFEEKFDSRDLKKRIPTRYDPEPKSSGSIYGADNPTPLAYDHPTPSGKLDANRGVSTPQVSKKQAKLNAVNALGNIPLAGADPFAGAGAPTAPVASKDAPHNTVAPTPDPFAPGFQESVADSKVHNQQPLFKSPLFGPAAYDRTSASAKAPVTREPTTYAKGKTWAPTDPFTTGSGVPAPPAATPASLAPGANPNVASGLKNVKYPGGVEKPTGKFDDKSGTNDVNPGTPAAVSDPAALNKGVNEDSNPLMTQRASSNPGSPALHKAGKSGETVSNPGNAGNPENVWDSVSDNPAGAFGTSADTKATQKADAAP
eukprot:TRINITY_DN1273_c1_g1_i1.p1 TRINITY_DN1273_c1_g1~~TRINITY_DN1273_c1_g1_i1.p1  ORF type:complete len:547 (+),score=191.14 TRINITY_DN1273_c1_g1_i1:259-1899(+)